MDESLTTQLSQTIPNSVSILACLWFFYCYFHIPKRSIGLHMILTLSISDIIFHSSMLFIFWYNGSLGNTIGSIISNSALKFSIFWSSNIAYFLYRLLKFHKTVNPQRYYRLSLVILFSLSLSLTLIAEFLDQKLGVIDLTIMAGLLPLSIIVTTTFYMKSIALLRNYASSTTLPLNKSTRVLYLYAFVQLITVGPLVLYSYIHNFVPMHSMVAVSAIYILVGLSGLANALVYFFQRLHLEGDVDLTRRTSVVDPKMDMSISLENTLNLEAYSYVC